MAVVLVLLSALAAALLGVAAARRGWCGNALICGACTLALLMVSMFLATGGRLADLPWWVHLIAALADAFLLLTAWSVHRDREKAITGEDTR